MRKGAALAAAAALACSLVCLSACGLIGGPVNNDGSISGNYRPVTTDIEFLQVVDSIQGDKVLGDVNADEWRFGLEYATDRLLSLRSGETNWKQKESSFYRLVLDNEEEDALQMRGSGSGSSSLFLPAGVYADGPVQLFEDSMVCNDAQSVYRDDTVRRQGDGGAEEERSRTESSLEELVFGAAEDALFGLPVQLMADIVAVANGGDAEDSFIFGMGWEESFLWREQLESCGIALEADLSDGVKLRLSASEETMRLVLANTIAESVGAEDADIALLAQALPIRFVQCSYDIYVAVDGDGLFSGMGVRADIEAVIEGVSYDLATGLPYEEEEDAGEIRLTIRGMERLSAYGGDVVLPDDLGEPLEPEEEEGLPEQPDEEAVPEEPAGDAAEDGADAETDAVALPTAEQFREAFAEAFDTLWREMYAAALEAPAETVPDAALSPDGPGIE